MLKVSSEPAGGRSESVMLSSGKYKNGGGENTFTAKLIGNFVVMSKNKGITTQKLTSPRVAVTGCSWALLSSVQSFVILSSMDGSCVAPISLAKKTELQINLHHILPARGLPRSVKAMEIKQHLTELNSQTEWNPTTTLSVRLPFLKLSEYI